MSLRERIAMFGHLAHVAPRTDTLPAAQRELWPRLADVPLDFVLYGGTALALRLGHRESLDFDFCAPTDFAPGDLLAGLGWLGVATIDRASPNTLSVTTNTGVHVSFFGHMAMAAIAPPELVEENGLLLASLADLAGTTAKTIYDRAEWKDYADIACLLRAGVSLAEILGCAEAIFAPLVEFPTATVLRALTYFEEGTVGQLDPALRRELVAAVAETMRSEIPVFVPALDSILPV